MIAPCLAYSGYQAVHIPTDKDEDVKLYLRMRDDHKTDLKARQNGNSSEVIAYADKANERLRRKYYKMIRHDKKSNVAVTAVAREFACLIWGMMTDNISVA